MSIYELAPGVMGYATCGPGGEVYVPFIEATKPGTGDVGRFLDSLAPGTKVPNVISGQLVGMLERRGWMLTFEETDLGPCDVWVKP